MVKCKKYLLINEENKIFCYFNSHDKLSIPTIYDEKRTDVLGNIIVSIAGEEAVFLGSYRYVRDNHQFKVVNGKLQKVEKQKDYYVMRVHFSEEDIRRIVDACEERNVVPEFLSIEEIQNYIDNSYHERENEKDLNMRRVINRLQKKLSYQEY